VYFIILTHGGLWNDCLPFLKVRSWEIRISLASCRNIYNPQIAIVCRFCCPTATFAAISNGHKAIRVMANGSSWTARKQPSIAVAIAARLEEARGGDLGGERQPYRVQIRCSIRRSVCVHYVVDEILMWCKWTCRRFGCIAGGHRCSFTTAKIPFSLYPLLTFSPQLFLGVFPQFFNRQLFHTTLKNIWNNS